MIVNIEEKVVQTSKKVVGTQITQEAYNFLLEQAKEDYMSVSDVLRKIIYTYIKSKENAKLNVKED